MLNMQRLELRTAGVGHLQINYSFFKDLFLVFLPFIMLRQFKAEAKWERAIDGQDRERSPSRDSRERAL